MLRVLFAAHSPFRGGAEYCLDTTLRHLDRSRIEPVVVFPFDGPLVADTRALDIETHVLPMCHWMYFEKDLWYWRNLVGRSLGNIRRLSQLIVDSRIDLVYTNTAVIYEPAFAARRAAVPHLWHIHEVLARGNSMRQLLPISWIQRIIRRYADRVVFESNAARAAFEQHVTVPHGDVVFNSVRLGTDLPAAAVDEARRTLGLDPGVPTVLFVGQFIDRKNPLLLIDAIAQLPRDLRLHCLLVGAGPLAPEIEARAASAGVRDRCRIVPFQANIAPVIAASDVLVLPSRQESFGLVLVEAAAFGKPSIACRSQGPCEIIEQEETGLLVAQDDARTLASAIERLVTEPETARRMGQAARARAQRLFSAESNTRALEALMFSMVSTTARPVVREVSRA